MAVRTVTVGVLSFALLLVLSNTSAWMMSTTSKPLGRTHLSLSDATTTSAHNAQSLKHTLTSSKKLPKLIVFDLDNTLWTPELYQIRQRNVPIAEKQIRLFPDAREILNALHELPGVQLAIASRTSKYEWAHQLLDDFQVADGRSLRSYFSYVEIQKGSKKQHFANLRAATGVAYSEMLFIDDDVRMNLGEVSQMGVLCCHTPRGVTAEYVQKSIIKYQELSSGHDSGHWMGYVLNDENLNIAGPVVASGEKCQGRIKFYSSAKKFGFVVDEDTGNEYFFHESKIPAGMRLNPGDKVEFEASEDSSGRPSAIILGDRSTSSEPARNRGMESMKCFTMSQPFAALLLNGMKTIESRNNPMFMDVAPGTQLLLHCGQKDWHDMKSYREILSSAGMSEEEIDKQSRLLNGFSKGAVIGMVTVGKTYKASERERQGADLQRKVLAPYDGIGRFCTEIIDARWLNKPFKARGSPGVYDASVPQDCLPSRSST